MTLLLTVYFLIMNNKLIKYLSLSLLACLVFQSCTTYEKFSVSGTPGTVVYDPERKPMGTINGAGELTVKVPSDSYYGYLYTRNDSLDLWVPFGLNTIPDSHKANKALFWGGVLGVPIVTAGIAGAGIAMGDVGFVIGTILGSCTFAGGMPTLLCVSFSRDEQLSYLYNFSYEKKQFTNNDIQLTRYIAPTTIRNGKSGNNQSGKKSNLKSSTKGKNSKAKKTSSTTKTNKTKKSNLKKGIDLTSIRATYSGTGELTSNKRVISKYTNLSLALNPTSETAVEVIIYIDKNTKVFDEPELFILNKEESTNGKIVLYLNDNPGSKIVISGNNISYLNPDVNVDDEIFTLSIQASKK